jgi:hypothetical protein
MFRKLVLAAAATVALGAAALTPTTASAWHGGHGGGWHGGYGGGGWHGGDRGPRFAFGGPVYGAYAGGCIRNRWVNTPWGPRMRRVNVCY